MRSRRLALPPRCGSKWSARCSAQIQAGTTAVYLLYLAQQDPRTMVLDQVGWSEGGPHIVNQLTFVISVRERLQTHEN